MLRNFIIIIMLVIFMQPAAARMYQWVDPVSGRTQLSGTPPAWYRSGGDAPRVFVFENGQLVDDTGISVEEVQRRRLREEALVRAEENTEAAKRKAEQSALLRSRLDDDGTSVPPLPELPDAAPPEDDTLEREAAAETAAEPGEPELTDEQITELRRLISEWESRNQSRARELLRPEDTRGIEATSRETLREFLDQNPEPQR